MPQLTEVKIRSIKAGGRIQRYHDRRGLYLETSIAGGKFWRWRYRFAGKEKRLSLGAWPDVTLKEAREKCDGYRIMVRDGIDPASIKRKSRSSSNTPPAKDGLVTFEAVAREYVAKQKETWAESYALVVEQRFDKDVYPAIGFRPIQDVSALDVLAILRLIEERRAFVTASRVLGACSRVFRYGVAIGVCLSDPCRDLKGALTPAKKGKFAAITRPKDIGALLLAIDDYMGSSVVRAALLFSALTFCRPGEIRMAEWREIDFDAAEWTIPATKMKGKIKHLVPLSRQALAVLKGIKVLTGIGQYVFPSPASAKRPISECTVLAALRRMGFTKDQMTAHGFRAMASTILNEHGKHRPDVIEAQLAHKSADKVRAAYNRARYNQERRDLMQDWADYLDGLRAAAASGLTGR